MALWGQLRLVHRLTYNGDVVAFKMGRRSGLARTRGGRIPALRDGVDFHFRVGIGRQVCTHRHKTADQTELGRDRIRGSLQTGCFGSAHLR